LERILPELAGEKRASWAQNLTRRAENQMARQLFDVVMGGEGEGPPNAYGHEYIVSIAAAGPTLGGESGDYGIWTSESGPSTDLTADAKATREVRRKKAA
jgi:hypothetical protein